MAQEVWANTFRINGNKISQEKKQKLQKEPNDLKEERKADMGEVQREKAKQTNKTSYKLVDINISIINLNVNDLKTQSKDKQYKIG